VKIHTKLFFSFLIGSIVLVTAMYGLMQWSFDQGMTHYVSEKDLKSQATLAPKLADLYEKNGSWQFLKNDRRLLRKLFVSNFMVRQIEGPGSIDTRRIPLFNSSNTNHQLPPKNRTAPGPDSRSWQGGPPPAMIVLLDKNKKVIFGHYDPSKRSPMLPVDVKGETVGWLTLAPRKHISDAFDVNFAEQQQTAFSVISIIVLTLSVCLAYPTAIALTRPIKKIAAASHELASGNFALQIDYSGKDEIGLLSRDFNYLAKALSANETSRRRWIADISHELRTPVALTRAELEAMIDGVNILDIEHIKLANQEVLHLQRIITDLYELATADIGALSYYKEPLDLTTFIKEIIEKMQEQAECNGLTILSTIPNKLVPVWADATRLSQLFNNIIANSIKYTDSGGEIHICLEKNTKFATIVVEDSFPGVLIENLDKLFNSLYRVESSRNKKTGGSGLGLAICKNIAEGHSGTITVEPSNLGGLKTVITLPLDVDG